MGDGKLKAAVVDAGPLIHLTEIGCLRLLRIFRPLWVPHAVWLETAKQNHLSQINLSEEANILEYSAPQSAVAQFTKEKNLSKLHTGERECFYDISSLFVTREIAELAIEQLRSHPKP